MTTLERLALAGQAEWRIVKLAGQSGLDIVIEALRQRRDERQREVQFADRMMRLFVAVVEVDAPADDADVVQGKARWRGIGLGRCLGHEQVGKIVTDGVQADDPQLRRLQRDFAQHGSLMPEARKLCVGGKRGELQQRAILFVDRDIAQRRAQQIRVDLDLADRDLAVQRGAGLFFQPRAQQRRQRQRASQAEKQQQAGAGGQDNADAAGEKMGKTGGGHGDSPGITGSEEVFPV